MIFVSTSGCASSRKTALGGQSVVQVPHRVLGGNACTNGAVPKNSTTNITTTLQRIARSSPRSIRPSGNASSRYTTHGNVSQVDRRPIVYGTLRDVSVSAVSDHAK